MPIVLPAIPHVVADPQIVEIDRLRAGRVLGDLDARLAGAGR